MLGVPIVLKKDFDLLRHLRPYILHEEAADDANAAEAHQCERNSPGTS